MKLLKILNSNDEGGVLQAETQYLKEFRNQGIEIYSVIVGNGRNKELYESLSDFSVILPETDLSIKGNPLQKLKSILFLKKWAKSAVKTIPDEIKNQSYSGIIFGRIGLMFLSYYLSKENKAKSYYYMHGKISDSKSLAVYNFLFKTLAITVISNSRYTMQSFKNHCQFYFYPGYDKTRIAQCYKGKTFRNEYGIVEDTLVFGIAGRICDFKAQDWITKILMSEKFNNENVVLLVAGIVQDEIVLERIKQYAGSNFGKKIIYVGNLSEMSKFYASINVLINSGKGPESFGISVVEARASGLPIIASNVGGTAETVQDGYNGWSFQGFTFDSYEEVFNRVFKQKNKIEEYGKNSLKDIDKFTAKTNVEQFVKLLKSK
ncbi:glycosyltransferase family 4 protein [Empedobacter falsenii]